MRTAPPADAAPSPTGGSGGELVVVPLTAAAVVAGAVRPKGLERERCGPDDRCAEACTMVYLDIEITAA